MDKPSTGGTAGGHRDQKIEEPIEMTLTNADL